MEAKPGYKTTEFWLTVAGNVASLVLMVAELLPPAYGVPAQIFANALYVFARGYTKGKVADAKKTEDATLKLIG